MDREPLIDEEVCASMFTPSESSIPKPRIGDEIRCPKCGKMWTIPVGWSGKNVVGHKILTDLGILPK